MKNIVSILINICFFAFSITYSMNPGYTTNLCRNGLQALAEKNFYKAYSCFQEAAQSGCPLAKEYYKRIEACAALGDNLSDISLACLQNAQAQLSLYNKEQAQWWLDNAHFIGIHPIFCKTLANQLAAPQSTEYANTNTYKNLALALIKSLQAQVIYINTQDIPDEQEFRSIMPNDHQKELEEIEKYFTEHAQDNIEYDYYLGIVYLSRGLVNKAKSQFLRGANKSHTESIYNYAQLAYDHNDKANAQKFFECIALCFEPAQKTLERITQESSYNKPRSLVLVNGIITDQRDLS